jgi:nucleotide-binding universal stress UspA family protein
VLPDDAPPTFYGDRILVAWRNTPEAGRAIHDALPLLTAATEVILAEVTQAGAHDRPAVAIDDMAEHLRAHGVPVTARQFPAEDAAAGERLIAAATEVGADLIVAGGYGHSRFREWVLGGVTRTLLHNGTLPCLLSH